MTHDEAADLVGAAASIYGVEVTPNMVEMWANTFHSASLDEMAEALALWVDTEERMPTPAGLRGKRREIARQNLGNEAPIPEIETGGRGRFVGFTEGIQIAYEAYCGQARQLGNEPKDFDTFRHNLAGQMGARR